MPEKTSDPGTPDAEWLRVVLRKVKALRFGSIQIIVHDGRVIQVESLEKFRLSTNTEGSRPVS